MSSPFDVVDSAGRRRTLHVDVDPTGGYSLRLESADPTETVLWRLRQPVRVPDGSRLSAWTLRDTTAAWIVVEVTDVELRITVTGDTEEVEILEMSPNVGTALKATFAGSPIKVSHQLRDEPDGAARVAALRRFVEGWDDVRRSLRSPFWIRNGNESEYHGASFIELRREKDGWELRVSIPDA